MGQCVLFKLTGACSCQKLLTQNLKYFDKFERSNKLLLPGIKSSKQWIRFWLYCCTLKPTLNRGLVNIFKSLAPYKTSITYTYRNRDDLHAILSLYGFSYVNIVFGTTFSKYIVGHGDPNYLIRAFSQCQGIVFTELHTVQ